MSTDSNNLPPLRFEMLSQPRYLSAVRSMVGSVSQRFGFSDHECSQISLAIDEALCNVINHGYERRLDGRIWVSVWPLDDPDGLRVVIEDNARQVDLEKIEPRDLDDVRPGGLGVHIIREVMDRVEYSHRDAGGMRLVLDKYVGSPSGRDTPETDSPPKAEGG